MPLLKRLLKILIKPIDSELEFGSRLYFQNVWGIELHKLTNDKKLRYCECLIESKNKPVFAYSCKRITTWATYRKLLPSVDLSSSFKRMSVLNPKSLIEYIKLKLNSNRSDAYLIYGNVNIMRFWNFAYFMMNDNPQIPLLINDLQNEIKKDEQRTETIRKSITKLRNEKDHKTYFYSCYWNSCLSCWFLALKPASTTTFMYR